MNRMPRVITLSSLILILLFSLFSCSQPDAVSIESLLNEMVDREAIAKYPDKNFRLKQESSYNRASVSPEDSKGWFTNHDYNSSDKDHNFLRIDTINGEREWVMMDHDGAGAIVRTWMPFAKSNTPNTTNIIRIYLDGSETPTLEGNMLGMFNGTGLFPYPFAHKSLRSAVSFFPIPYAKGCKITVTERPFFYQFTYREYDEGTAVKTFTLEDYEASKDLITEVGEALIHPTAPLVDQDETLKITLQPQEEKSISLPKGVAAIKGLSLKLGSYQDSSVTRSVVLKMNFDGKETVWCPVGDFFGSGVGLHPFQGWYRTVAEDGLMSSRWVMPYQETAEVSVVNYGKDPVDIDLNVLVGDWQWDERSMYFHANWRGQYPVPTRPFSDWNYITIKGRGVYAGDALTIMNPVKKWWGEGDERIYVDGEDFPSIFGTGTEDYYAYSWGGVSTDFYEHPFHAQPRSHKYNKLNRNTGDERNTLGYSTETRTRALDGMPFSSSLQLDMEVWSGTDCDMAYGVGVYWYGDAEATSNRTPDPEGILVMPEF